MPARATGAINLRRPRGQISYAKIGGTVPICLNDGSDVPERAICWRNCANPAAVRLTWVHGTRRVLNPPNVNGRFRRAQLVRREQARHDHDDVKPALRRLPLLFSPCHCVPSAGRARVRAGRRVRLAADGSTDPSADHSADPSTDRSTDRSADRTDDHSVDRYTASECPADAQHAASTGNNARRRHAGGRQRMFRRRKRCNCALLAPDLSLGVIDF